MGNTIDFGADPDIGLERSIQEGLTGHLDNFDMGSFRDRSPTVPRVLYIDDNGGEIVFAIIHFEEIGHLGVEVTLVGRN